MPFDPLAAEFLADPYPTYARLRQATEPLVRNGPTQFVAARYGPVAALLRNPRLRNDFPPAVQTLKLGDGPARDFVVDSLLHQEGPRHAELRHRWGGRLRPTGALRARVGELVDELLAPALERGELDVARDLALPLPLAVACELFDVPSKDREAVGGLGVRAVRAFTMVLPEAERSTVDEAVAGLRSYFGGPEVDHTVFLFVSGFTTAVHLIGSVGALLLAYPEQWARLRAEPGLVAPAVEEALRFDAPLQHVSRLVAERVEWGGVVLRPGRVVHLLLGSANRDEDRFPGADRFDVGRVPNPHLSFGAATHQCLGAGLGRLEAVTVVERILARCAVFEAAGPAERRPMQVFRGYERVPAHIRPR